jgi:hypothetical protein
MVDCPQERTLNMRASSRGGKRNLQQGVTNETTRLVPNQ